ncbi:replicase polyprotein 1 [Acrasis kona]|uniref:Replicase polyprotein 1 n=1 Tax=Acrasis kona TaxID=1008807 RepID=A0AAW2ZG26_9EUKA
MSRFNVFIVLGLVVVFLKCAHAGAAVDFPVLISNSGPVCYVDGNATFTSGMMSHIHYNKDNVTGITWQSGKPFVFKGNNNQYPQQQQHYAEGNSSGRVAISLVLFFFVLVGAIMNNV